MRRTLLLVAASLLGTLTCAQTPPDLTAFFRPLTGYPALQAAREQVVTARAQLHAAYDPAALQASGGYTAFDNQQVDLNPTQPGIQGLPASAGQISASLTLRPWLFGDTADQADRGRIQLQQAELAYANALTGLQVQALQAAYGLQLARESLTSAQQGAALAQAALDATRLRHAKGAASDRDLRDAETGLAQARLYVTNADGSVALAEATLKSLLGSSAAPDLAALTLAVPKGGTALAVQRAHLDEALAEISVRGATRSVYPVVQAGYTWNVDSQDSVGISIESRTLQPKVSYSFQSPGTAYPQDHINGSFQIGVSASFSPAVLDGLTATAAQLRAARDAAAAAERSAAIQKASLDNDLAQAHGALQLAQRRVDDATTTLKEDTERQQLGLTSPLATQQAALDLTQRQLDLQQARQAVLAKVLAYYSFYAHPLVSQPVSEVQP